MQFEWDLSKEMANTRKHGVAFSEAVESFFDPHGFQLVDAKHSRKEGQFLLAWKITGRAGSYDPVYPAGELNPDHRIRGVAKVQETLL